MEYPTIKHDTYPNVVSDMINGGCHDETAAGHLHLVYEPFATFTVGVGIVDDHTPTSADGRFHSGHTFLPRA